MRDSDMSDGGRAAARTRSGVDKPVQGHTFQTYQGCRPSLVQEWVQNCWSRRKRSQRNRNFV